MPANNQNNQVELKIVKPSFIKFIKLVREIRLNSLGKCGEIEIPKSELDKIADLKINFFIKQLINDNILVPLKSSKTGYKLKSGNITINCNSVGIIDEYLINLYVPGSFGLIIEKNGGHISRYGRPDKYFNFKKQDAAILDFLYRNVGKLQTDTVIAEACEVILGKTLISGQISYSLTNIRRRLKEKLGFSENEANEILPKYKHGGRVLKI